MNDLQLFLRSGSLKLVLNRGRRKRGNPQAWFKWNGQRVYYRPGTSDIGNIRQLLLCDDNDAEYNPPHDLHPTVILDIGANTGMASLRFARLYPQARIYAFEPIPSNFALLSLNTAPYANITALQVALGANDGTLRMHGPADGWNFISHSALTPPAGGGPAIEVSGRHAGSLLRELGITQVDLLKIDVEGAEHEVLVALPDDLLKKTGWILGETHGYLDFELLLRLNQHFELGISKPLGQRLLKFSGRNRASGRCGSVPLTPACK